MRDGLVEDRQAVANRSLCRVSNDVQRLGFRLDAFLFADRRKMRFEQFGRDAPQIEPLRAAEHCHRKLFDLRGGEQELHMRGRFFQRLEQGVESVARQHVDFVDNVDLVARRNRRVAHRFDDLAHIVDAGMTGGVHLDHVDMAPLGNRAAGFAHAAGTDGRAALPVGSDAVQGLRDKPGGGCLAHPAHARHQEGMRQPVARDRIGQRTHHRFLPDEFGEALRPVLARENAVGLCGIDRRRIGGIYSWRRRCFCRAIGMRRHRRGRLRCSTAEHLFLPRLLEVRRTGRIDLLRGAVPRGAVRIVR